MGSSGHEEYETIVPASLNAPTQFGSYFSLVSQSNHQNSNPSLFDPSLNNYLLPLSQSQPVASIPNYEPNSSIHLPNVPSSSLSLSFLLAGNQSVGGCSSEAAVQEHDNNINGGVWAPPTTNAVRNSRKRSRASRGAPTTVLTTDTSNFRSMVQEFTGIPAPPSSASSYSRRFHPFRPSSHNLHPLNPSLPLSSSPNINTPTTATAKNVVDAISSTNATNNTLASHQLLPDLSFAFQTPPHHFTIPLPTRFSSKSQPSGSGYEPCSVESHFSEWPISTTNSWPSSHL